MRFILLAEVKIKSFFDALCKKINMNNLKVDFQKYYRSEMFLFTDLA